MPDRANTLLEAVALSLRHAAAFNPEDVTRPVAVIWTDPRRQWVSIIPTLRSVLPALLTHGEHEPTSMTGPTIWLRTAIEGRLEEVRISENEVPVLYLPGVSRQKLRAAHDCPTELQPLIELQFRGVTWTQKNGRDWSVEAFMVSRDGGLGLDLANDEATKYALNIALAEVAITPLSKLRGKRLEASDFDSLLTEDLARDVLTWLNDPDGIKNDWPKAKWKAFCSRVKSELDMKPGSGGPLVAAERLGSKEGQWHGVWDRFAEAPGLYPGVIDLLHKATPPQQDAFTDESSWPGRNQEYESQLRGDLIETSKLQGGELLEGLRQLEQTHGRRRDWVWTKLGQAPLAQALLHLERLAAVTEKPLLGSTVEQLAEAYETNGWRADRAVIEALRTVTSIGDREAISLVTQAVYMPWMDASARALQQLLDDGAEIRESTVVDVVPGGVILFADGLRFDAGQRLRDLLDERGFKISLAGRWAALPSVTASGKPAVSPVLDLIRGEQLGEKFAPLIKDGGKEVTTARFRKLLDEQGYQVLGISDIGDPSGKAWTEHSDLDSMGHKLQIKLVDRIEEELRFLCERVAQLFEAGWQEVRIVTDHGWLLAPKGLPKTELPHFLVKSRWARCAAIKGDSKVDVPIVRWFWNDGEWLATAPGASCFTKGNQYAHGGVSLQECRIPDLRVTPGDIRKAATTVFKEIKWLGLRCQVTLENPPENGAVELRLKTNDAASSLTDQKPVDDEGMVKLLVADDEHEGSPAAIVVLNSAGHVIARSATIVGGESND